MLPFPSFWPPIVPYGRIIRFEGPNEFDLFQIHFFVGSSLRLPNYFFPDSEVSHLLSCEVFLNEFAVSTAKIVDGIRKILADVNFTVWIGNFIDHFHGLHITPHNFTVYIP